MTFLLDANVLIALCFPEHIHFPTASAWLQENPSFAVCPFTEGALVRFIVRSYAEGAKRSEELLLRLSAEPGYEFWSADIPFRHAHLARITGHKQVTDAYLVALAQAHGGSLATLDRALTVVHPEARLVSLES